MRKLLFGFFCCIITLPAMAKVTLSGAIIDHEDAPLAGAAVAAVGTTKGFIADADGKFDDSLDVADDATIEISFVGCESQQFKASELKNKTIKLDCTNLIDEVVVIAKAPDKLLSVSGEAGCDDEENEYIAPDLALCSTHVYNIGVEQNPTTDDERGYMQDVVALKTTLMTQQLNKQYEYMESMIGRFRTQLEKAVLLTKLQKAGATDSVSGSSGASSGVSSLQTGDRNVYLADAKNCNNELLPSDVVTCLNGNLNLISSITDYGNDPTFEAKKQLVNDYVLLDGTGVGCSLKEKHSMCANSSMNSRTFRDCMESMRTCLRNVSYNLSQDSNKRNSDK